MADPGYDFFATGHAAEPAEHLQTHEPAPVNRFGNVEPAPVPTAAATPPMPTPPPMTPPPPIATPIVAAAGYNPGAVNQFGTPLDLPAVPTGPFAAPGIGAAPIPQPGLVSTWGAPVGSVTTAPPPPPAMSRFGGPLMADASGGFGASALAPAPPVRSVAAAQRPGPVLAAGVIGIVEGVIVMLAAVAALIGYVALNSQMAQLDAQLAASPEFAGSGMTGLVAGVSTMILVGAMVLALVGVLYLAAGIAAVRGRRWGAWTLLVVSAISVLYALYELIGGSGSALVTLAVSGAVVVLLMISDSQRWLRQS